MLWTEIRDAYPDQWLIVEALEAHTTPDNQRHLDRMAVIDRCSDGSLAMKGCRRLYQRFPDREFYFVHTSRGELEIRERLWLGIRGDRSLTPSPDIPLTELRGFLGKMKIDDPREKHERCITSRSRSDDGHQ